MAVRTRSSAGSTPNSCSTVRTGSVATHGWGRFPVVPGREQRATLPEAVLSLEVQQPGAPALVARALRSAATSSAGAPSRSAITCQRMAGSASRSQSMAFMRAESTAASLTKDVRFALYPPANDRHCGRGSRSKPSRRHGPTNAPWRVPRSCARRSSVPTASTTRRTRRSSRTPNTTD